MRPPLWSRTLRLSGCRDNYRVYDSVSDGEVRRLCDKCSVPCIELTENGFRVILIGGELKAATEAIVGNEAYVNLQKYNFTKGFFGTNGLNRTSGFTTPDINEAMIKECALKHTQKPYILCDSSKFLQTCPVSFGEFHSARIITDRYPEESMETEGHIIIAK